ncbi:flavin monoamine oxidase family protein [Nocardioides nitrophenolicus]|uniref:flavin monoamine oxidase family protein n=1 Tax=Nocardioides nitrophenolicus TaxID=60489 RepID=UPI00195F0626|nr:NAD(P)/FAD-dependent oxidoreductase [Nocardioides nitrophenolicus]MBM7517086.1 monoamine oxidase [Nocardioides nitrophenolicus]
MSDADLADLADRADLADCIVVGAGVAGLTAARLLAAAGRRVVVLEARDRVGGRTHSRRHDGLVTDLGASWIHGIDANPLHAAVAALGMPTTEFSVGSFQPDSRPIAYYGPDGARLDAAQVEAFAADVRAVDERLAGVIAASARGTSYETVAEEALADLAWPADRAERVREFLRHRTEEQYGVWIGELDAHGLDDDQVEGDEVVFPEGFDALALRLAEGLDVRLGQVVTRVEWSADGVVVRCGDQEVRAGRAIVTVPVGVLRSGTLVIDPPLPEPMAGALDRLEMNAFEKVFLRFPERFWAADVYAIRRQGPAASWWHSWYDLTPLHGVPTLLTFAAGPCARAVRGWSDEAITASVLAALREIHPDADLTPTSVEITRWQDDPFARGSYAYMSVGSTTEDHDVLATPVAGVLHLAGEATWTEDPATVTAALRSGHRAAENVLGRAVPIETLWTDPLATRPAPGGSPGGSAGGSDVDRRG